MTHTPHAARRIARGLLLLASVSLAAAFVAAPAGAAPDRTSRNDRSGTIAHKQITPAFGASASPRAAGRPGKTRPAPANNGISYHGGPILLGTTNVYYIWYGDWTKDALAQPILTDLASNIGGSPYFNINTTYYNGSNQFGSNSVHFGGATTDNYS